MAKVVIKILKLYDLHHYLLTITTNNTFNNNTLQYKIS